MLIIPINTIVGHNRDRMRASMRRARRARGWDDKRSFGRCVVRYVWGGEVYGER